MALDEPKEDDSIFTEKDVTYLVNKNLFEQVKPIKIDFVRTAMGSGFHVTGSLEKTCGSCSC